ncbi:MAG: prephenate dehydratase [Phycisphaerales bacterium]
MKRPAPDPRRAAELTAALDRLRVNIDRLDAGLVDLLNKRAESVVEVGRIKRELGIPIYAPHREAEVLGKVQSLSKGPLPPKTIESVYRELMSGSFRLELPLRIGYLGPPGSYSHLAAVKHFGSSVDFEDLRAIEGVFTEVARGHVDYGLVPIENSIGGGIAETLQAFQDHHAQVNVYAEVQIEVHHALLANCPPSRVRQIYSKPEVFTQCRTWLATQYPQAELIAEASSSRAVMKAAESGPEAGIAAIGSILAAEIYGISVLFENIEDRANNITRFFVISRQKALPGPKDADGRSTGDKTSIMFTTTNEPGALVSVLSVFQRAGINLTHIDKRPSGRSNWQYTFFIDAEGHIDDPWFASAVAQAKGLCRELHVLGSFPKSRRIL